MAETQNFSIEKVKRKDGTVVDLNPDETINSLKSAILEAGIDDDQGLINMIITEVNSHLENEFKEQIPSEDMIYDLISNILIEKGFVDVAKIYIISRHKKKEERERRALIMGASRDWRENLNFSNEALRILESRYLLKDDQGYVIETPKQMLRRVAKNIASADKKYGATKEEIQILEDHFFSMMAELNFLPNSPTLMNANTHAQQLSSCVVLPVEDSMESIFGTLKDAALIHQRGTGTGFSFSRLRPRNDKVERNLGVAAGPLEFLKVYDAALEVVKQGGIRPGANMAVLRVDHPDIIRFIESKRDKVSLKNFNISVAVTDRFMRAVENDRDYNLSNPRIGKYYGRFRARDIFALITQSAWRTGDPGLIFIDEINRKHPAKHLGNIETTNQCGEAPLLPYEGCPLGSINIANFVNEEDFDLEWERLKETIRLAIHFMDNVIDMNNYPNKKIELMSKNTRKFGLGIMGFADMLFKLKLKYDSDEGLEFADKMMSFFKDTAYQMSGELAEKRGVCPAWEGSDHQKLGRKIRNMTCLSIAPTGTISILAGTSSGCEPLFALSYQRTVLTDNELVYINKNFEKVAKQRGFYSPELIRKISRYGSIQQMKEIPKDVRDLFVMAQDIKPEWHVKMQATLQRYVDNSISKTINFDQDASIKDVEDAYLLAWKEKCKGITIYRDGSYDDQVINIGDGF